MSIEEIIKELEGMSFILERNRDRERTGTMKWNACNDRIVAIHGFIALLKTHPDAQPNEPLTMEELREMDGEPVWVKHLPYPDYSAWWIIGWMDGECALSSAKNVNRGYTAKNYGEYWLAYRRPQAAQPLEAKEETWRG